MSDVIILISSTFQNDDLGQQIPVETRREVYCEIESIAQNEFFTASQIGLKPSFKAVIFRYDYNGETTIEYNGKRSSIYRTFIRKDEKVELYVEERAEA